MATLTEAQLAKLRKTARQGYDWGEIDFTKPDANAAFQALEDWYQANKAEAGTMIDTASSYDFTNAQKKVMAAAYFKLRFDADGGG